MPKPHRYRRVTHLEVSLAVLDARVNDEEQRCRILAVGQRCTGHRASCAQVVAKPLHEGSPISHESLNELLLESVFDRQLSAPWTLYWSWALFTAATCATIISFLVSGKALEAQKGRAYAYYMQGDDDALKRGNAWDRGTRLLNYTSGGSFLLAMVLSVVFISINLEKGSAMKDSNTPHSGGYAELLKKGLTVPTMQQVQRPPAQPASSQTTPAPAPASTPASK